MRSLVCARAAFLALVATVVTTVLVTGSVPAVAAHPAPPTWHAEVTQVINYCDHTTKIYFQLERRTADQWDRPDGTYRVAVQRADTKRGWVALGTARTEKSGTWGIFTTSDPFTYRVRVQAPDGSWSYPDEAGGDLCEAPGQPVHMTVSLG